MWIEGVFVRMSENAMGGATPNHTPKGKFAPGNKAAVGVKREKLQARQRELNEALDEAWPATRIVELLEQAHQYALVYAEKYNSPKMLVQVGDLVIANRYGRPTQRIVMEDGAPGDDLLAILRGEDEPGDSA